jgi:transcriptional regulator with XRE-family HTH domain
MVQKMNTQKNKNDHKELGEKIKQARLDRKMKVIQVAEMAGLTPSMISQVERSTISPSIDSLKKIGNALSVPVSYFFAENDAEEKRDEIIIERDNVGAFIKETMAATVEKTPVVRKKNRKILSPEPGVTFHLLNPDMSGPIEFIYNIYEPGTGTGHDQYTHPGYECGLILEGELLVKIGDKEYLLEKDDSITFCSEIPHSKTNMGDVPCVCIWANTPPWF